MQMKCWVGKTKKCKSVIELLLWPPSAYSQVPSFTLGKGGAHGFYPVEEKVKGERFYNLGQALKFADELQSCCQGSTESFPFSPVV